MERYVADLEDYDGPGKVDRLTGYIIEESARPAEDETSVPSEDSIGESEHLDASGTVEQTPPSAIKESFDPLTGYQSDGTYV